MKVFISYKYTNTKDKDSLKSDLEKIAGLIEGWGDETFILGRDVKKWKHIHFGIIRLIPVVFKNMKTCDLVYAYVDSPVRSKGLFFELAIAKLLGKKSYLFLKEGIEDTATTNLATETIKIGAIQDIKKLY